MTTQSLKRIPRGFTMVELIIGGTILALVALSFVAVLRMLNKNYSQNAMKSKAMEATSSVMESIRSRAWDEWAVNNGAATNGRGVFVSTSPAHNASSIGADPGDTADAFDDVDDYDGKIFSNGPFRTQVQVFYVQIPPNGAMVIGDGNGKGIQWADRTLFKLVVASTTWNGGNLIVKTVTASGR